MVFPPGYRLRARTGIEFVGYGRLRVADWAADRDKLDGGRRPTGEGGRVGRKGKAGALKANHAVSKQGRGRGNSLQAPPFMQYTQFGL